MDFLFSNQLKSGDSIVNISGSIRTDSKLEIFGNGIINHDYRLQWCWWQRCAGGFEKRHFYDVVGRNLCDFFPHVVKNFVKKRLRFGTNIRHQHQCGREYRRKTVQLWQWQRYTIKYICLKQRLEKPRIYNEGIGIFSNAICNYFNLLDIIIWMAYVHER